MDRILGFNCSGGDVSVSGVDCIPIELKLCRANRPSNLVLHTAGGMRNRRHARCNGGDSGVGPIFVGFHGRGWMIYRQAGNFLIPCYIKVNIFSDIFIHILLKTIENNRFLISRITAFSSRPKFKKGSPPVKWRP